MRNKFPLCEIEWLDAMTYDAKLHSIEEVRKLIPIPTKTAGYLMAKTKDYIVVGMSIFAETEVHTQTFSLFWTIPKSCIKAIRYLDQLEGGE